MSLTSANVKPILAVDPGPSVSSWVVWDGRRIHSCGTWPNGELMHTPPIAALDAGLIVIEMVAGMGMPVGREVFETVFYIGRLYQLWQPDARLIYRRQVKSHLCEDSRAKDSNIRQALLDRLGLPGTKRSPGPTHGVSGGAWQALAVAVTWWDLNGESAALEEVHTGERTQS